MSEADTSRPWVLITGVSGLIGTKVADALAGSYRVIGLDVQRPSTDVLDHTAFIECDLTSDAATDAALTTVRDHCDGQLASVIHLAAYYDFSGAPSPLYDDLTVEGTRRLLRGLRRHIGQVEQFVFSSSLLVMKPTDDGSFLTEDSPVQAEWEYPKSKLDAEEVIRVEHGDVPVVILRMAGTYDEWGHSPPISQQIWRIRERTFESFLFPGNPSHGQAFVHLTDLVDCVRKTVDGRAHMAGYDVFLIGEPEVVSYGELQDQIGQLIHHHDWPTLRVPAPVAKVGAWVKEQVPGREEAFIKPWMVDLADAHYPVAIDRARRRLGWQPTRRLRDVLPRMVAALQEDPERWYRENQLPVDPAGIDGDRDREREAPA